MNFFIIRVVYTIECHTRKGYDNVKTAKKLIALVLSIAMLLGVCSVGASAFDTDEIITFEYLDSTTKECRYIGEFELYGNYYGYDGGETEVVYSFTAEESGYYATDNFNHYIGQKISDDKVKQIDVEINYYQLGCFYVYLEEGTYYFADSFCQSSPEPLDLSVEFLFLGEYEGVSYDEKVFELAIKDVDVDFYNGTVANAKPSINFSERDVEADEGCIYVECDSALELGSNNVTFEINGVEFTEELYIVELDDVIESVEAVDGSALNVMTEYYNLSYYDEPIGLKVVFADGTSTVTDSWEKIYYEWDVENNRVDSTTYTYYVELSNGRELPIYLEQDRETVEVGIGSRVFVSEDMVYEPVSFFENLSHLSLYIEEAFVIGTFFSAITVVFEQISKFISYYL